MIPTAVVTDPNPDIAESISALLELRGFRAVSATTLAAAEAMLTRDSVDLMVVHPRFPEEPEGTPWLDAMIERYARAAVVVMSGRTQDEFGPISTRWVYLGKPFGMDALDRAIGVAQALVVGPSFADLGGSTLPTAVIGFEVPANHREYGHEVQPIVALLREPPTSVWIEAFHREVALLKGPLAHAGARVIGDRIFLYSDAGKSLALTEELRRLVAAIGEKLHQQRMRAADAGAFSSSVDPFRR